MSTLLDHFQLRGVKAKFDKASGDPKRLFAYLDQSVVISFPPDERFAFHREGTLCFTFAPDWEPWSDPANLLLPCLVSGPDYKLLVTHELDALILHSSKESLRLEGDFSEGGTVLAFFREGATVLMVIRTKGQQTYTSDPGAFSWKPDDGSFSTLKFGGDDFAGAIGNVLLFDQNISAAVKSRTGQLTHLLEAWQKLDPSRVFQAYSAEPSDAATLSLLGVGFPGEATPRFDFIPREVMAPGARPRVWMLNDGDQRPIKVDVPGVNPADHSVYTTNQVFCFLRISPARSRPGGVYLWGDGGQRFVLTYMGNNQCQGVARSDDYGGKWNALHIDLTYAVNARAAHFPIRLTVRFDWNNATEKVFANYVCPPGATLPASIRPEFVWPAGSVVLKWYPEDYLEFAGIHDEMSEQWGSAFSKNGYVRFNMQGWDVTKLDNPLNPGNSTVGGKDDQGLIFATPTQSDKHYRSEKGSFTPHYCSTAPIQTTETRSRTTAYRNSTELSIQESKSFGLGLVRGEDQLAGCSFESVEGHDQQSTSESTVVLNRTTYAERAVLLEKQWLAFNPDFRDELKGITGKHDLFPLFDKWGTHYPNAITYGTGEYSIAFIDDAGAGNMVSQKNSSHGSLKIPIEECFLDFNASSATETSRQWHVGTKSETHLGLTIGSHEGHMPLAMDLRPISDLLQPPYFSEADFDWVYTAQGFVQSAIDEYLASAPKHTGQGSILYQSRLAYIENLTNKPLYFSARAFCVGVHHQDTSGGFWLPDSPAAVASWPPVWCRSLRLEPKEVHHSAAWEPAFRSMPVPRKDSAELVPELRVTGYLTWVDEGKITKNLTIPEDLWVDGAGGQQGTPAHHPSAAEVRAEADRLGHAALDPSGVAWAPWSLPETADFYAELVTQSYVKKTLRFADPGNEGQAAQVSCNLGSVRLTFEVRKVDLLKCFQPPSAPNYAVPATKKEQK